MLTENEKKVISLVQGDIPIVERPYKVLAERAEMSEDQFIEILEKLNTMGIIRRFGATLRHQKSGFSSNAMIAWKVDDKRATDVGKIMAEFTEVSHCYKRVKSNNWPYNLYTMVHARSQDECYEVAEKISAKTDVKEYSLLFSKKELKKTSMKYFQDI